MFTLDSQIRYVIASGGDPAEEPVTTAEAKTHLRITTSDDDTYIASCIKASRRYVEHYTGRPLVSTTFDQYFDYFKGCDVVLYWGNVSDVDSVNYAHETTGTETEFSSASYVVDKVMDRCRIRVATNVSWPNTYDKPNAVRIRYTAGFGDAADVPEDIKQAVLMLVAEMYEKRENGIKQLPTVVEWMLAPYKLWHI